MAKSESTKIEFGYFHDYESEQFAFYRIPKVLFTDEYFRNLSSDAKVLYGLMLDRMALSIRNNWVDNEGKVYIIFTLEQVMEYMNCGKDKGVKILAELDTDKGIGLIEIFIRQVIEEHFNRLENKGEAGMEKRTLAVQVTEELFQRVKWAITKEGVKQKDFIIRIIEKAVEEVEAKWQELDQPEEIEETDNLEEAEDTSEEEVVESAEEEEIPESEEETEEIA